MFMKKSLILASIFLITGCSHSNIDHSLASSNNRYEYSKSSPVISTKNDDTITEKSFFFNSNIKTMQYEGSFLFDDVVKEKVNLNINKLAILNDGELFELKIDPIAGIPDESLNLGYFYVQKDKIYKIEPTEENLNLLKTSNKLPNNSVMVCQNEALKDSLTQEEKGWHQYILVNGDKREYHSYNNLVETGYYESFTWEKECGLVNYSSGYGAGANSIELINPQSVCQEKTKETHLYRNEVVKYAQ